MNAVFECNRNLSWIAFKMQFTTNAIHMVLITINTKDFNEYS